MLRNTSPSTELAELNQARATYPGLCSMKPKAEACEFQCTCTPTAPYCILIELSFMLLWRLCGAIATYMRIHGITLIELICWHPRYHHSHWVNQSPDLHHTLVLCSTTASLLVNAHTVLIDQLSSKQQWALVLSKGETPLLPVWVQSQRLLTGPG